MKEEANLPKIVITYDVKTKKLSMKCTNIKLRSMARLMLQKALIEIGRAWGNRKKLEEIGLLSNSQKEANIKTAEEHRKKVEKDKRIKDALLKLKNPEKGLERPDRLEEVKKKEVSNIKQEGK